MATSTHTKTLSLLSIIFPLLLSLTSTSAAYIPASIVPTAAFSSLGFVPCLAGVPIWSPYQYINPHYTASWASPYIYNQFGAVSPYHFPTQAVAAPFFNQLQANQLFNLLQSNQLFNQQQTNQLFQHQQANQAFSQLEANQLFNQLQINQAFNQQQANLFFGNAQFASFLNLPSSVFAYPATRAIVV